ncbi:MAG: hypothetical protein IIZ67_02470 [Bacilli bacterium]|jgi:hypothetical protein|nr:hypothetical protein [Bacilli bacterium]
MEFFDNKGNNYSEEQKQENLNINDSDNGVDVNRKNQEEYRDLINKSTTDRSNFYDKDNVVVKLILLVLFIFIAVMAFFYISRGTN